MATVRVSKDVNAELNTIRAVSRAQEGDTIIVPNETCADIVRKSSKFLFIEIKE